MGRADQRTMSPATDARRLRITGKVILRSEQRHDVRGRR
jgi:hypothetical protein